MFPVDVDPTLQDLLAALVNVYQHVKPMPLYRYSGLCDLVGTEIWVKHENHHGVGSFKVRGGINLVAELKRGRTACIPSRPVTMGRALPMRLESLVPRQR